MALWELTVPDQNMLLRWPRKDPEPVAVDTPSPFGIGSTFRYGDVVWRAVDLTRSSDAGFPRVLPDMKAYVCDPVRVPIARSPHVRASTFRA